MEKLVFNATKAPQIVICGAFGL